MKFADFIAPVDERTFLEENFDKSPLHIRSGPTQASRNELLDWHAFLDALENVSAWQSGRLKMLMDSRPVSPEHYCVTREASSGPVTRPDRALIEAMMVLGASLVADGLEDVLPDVRRCCAMLGRQFAAKAGANLYASQAGVQAFASHCDPHEVFAVQCQGRKLWRIYADRADYPIQSSLLGDQAAIDRAKGPVIMQVMLEPGDILYIPRGFYHDAVAQDGRSIHLTFGVQPLYGAGLIDMLRDLAVDRPVLRQYLPNAEDSDALTAQLQAITEEIVTLLRSPALIEDIAVKQRTIASPIAENDTAEHTLLVRTAVPCEVVQPLDGSYLVIGSSRRPARLLSDAARWIFNQNAFTPMQCRARFCHHPSKEIDDLLDELVGLGALQKHAVGRV